MAPMHLLCPTCGWDLVYLDKPRAPNFAVQAKCEPCKVVYGIPLPRLAAVVGPPS